MVTQLNSSSLTQQKRGKMLRNLVLTNIICGSIGAAVGGFGYNHPFYGMFIGMAIGTVVYLLFRLVDIELIDEFLNFTFSSCSSSDSGTNSLGLNYATSDVGSCDPTPSDCGSGSSDCGSGDCGSCD